MSGRLLGATLSPHGQCPERGEPLASGVCVGDERPLPSPWLLCLSAALLSCERLAEKGDRMPEAPPISSWDPLELPSEGP